MVDYARVSGWAGIAVPIWTLGLMLLATLLSPSFAWTVNALSNLGAETDVATSLTIWVFNGGLLTGGVAGVAFAAALWLGSEHVVERIGAVVYGVAVLAMAGVGVFPQDRSLHFPMAAGFYLLFTVAFWCYGTGNVFGGEVRRGAATIALGVGHLAMWVAWVQIVGLGGGGLAIPEIVGALVFGGWTVATARVHLWGRRALGRPNS
jgi:hypothetical membrane protein